MLTARARVAATLLGTALTVMPVGRLAASPAGGLDPAAGGRAVSPSDPSNIGAGAASTTTAAGSVVSAPVPDLPPFPAPPVLAPLRVLRDVTIARAPLSYRKSDGREIEGWGADLYEARITPGPRSSAPPPRRGLIVMLPAGGIRKDLAATWARAFAKRGYAALALHRLPDTADEGVLHSLKGTAKTFAEDAANLRRVIDWAAMLPQIDPYRIGVLGVSRGAIASALVAEGRPDLSVVLALGGADLVGLFRDSRLAAVEKMRRRETDRNGGSLDRAVARAGTILGPVDPASWPGRLDPARTLLINARWDHVIPRAQALALRRAAGDPAQVWLPSGHYGALLWAGRVRRLALEHFARTMSAAPEGPKALAAGGRER